MGQKRSLTALALTLAACTSPATLAYRPDVPGSPTSGGYSEQAWDPTHYRVRISAPHKTRQAELAPLAYRRAAELSVMNGYGYFAIIQQSFVDHVYTAASRRGTIQVTYQPGYDAWATYWRLFRFGLGLSDLRTEPTWFLADTDRARFRRVEFNLDIEFRKTPGEGVVAAADILRPRKGGSG